MCAAKPYTTACVVDIGVRKSSCQVMVSHGKSWLVTVGFLTITNIWLVFVHKVVFCLADGVTTSSKTTKHTQQHKQYTQKHVLLVFLCFACMCLCRSVCC